MLDMFDQILERRSSEEMKNLLPSMKTMLIGTSGSSVGFIGYDMIYCTVDACMSRLGTSQGLLLHVESQIDFSHCSSESQR